MNMTIVAHFFLLGKVGSAVIEVIELGHEAVPERKGLLMSP